VAGMGRRPGRVARARMRPPPADPPSVAEVLIKPRWRGRLHVVAVAAAPVLAGVLVARARPGAPRAAAAAAVAGLTTTWATSAVYHALPLDHPKRPGWQRADHVTIYAGIAGTITPMCLTLPDRRAKGAAVAAVWAVAAAGALTKAVRGAASPNWPYLAMGWAGAVLVPSTWSFAGPAPVALIAAGGVAYTAGSVVLARQAPDPAPEVFGYHEVWHAATLGAAALHLLAVDRVTRRLR
jgi:hemolysin III